MADDKLNGKITNIEFELILEEARRTLPYVVQNWTIDAQSLKARYDALIKEGFTEVQALEIVKARGTQL